MSRLLAKRLNYRYLDTGAMYRAVGVAIMRAGIDLADREAISKTCKSLDIRFVQEGGATKIYLGNEDITDSIRTPAIDLIASTVSAFDIVREIMTRLQRKVASQGSLVAEGRDMGTVVFPGAQHKFYIDASLELRVDRRFQERRNRGESISRETVKADLVKRDHQDMNRPLSPLRPAKDATIIDTTMLSPQQVVDTILSKMRKAPNKVDT